MQVIFYWIPFISLIFLRTSVWELCYLVIHSKNLNVYFYLEMASSCSNVIVDRVSNPLFYEDLLYCPLFQNLSNPFLLALFIALFLWLNVSSCHTNMSFLSVTAEILWITCKKLPKQDFVPVTYLISECLSPYS